MGILHDKQIKFSNHRNLMLILLSAIAMSWINGQVHVSNKAEKPVFLSFGVYYGSFQVHTPKLSNFQGANPKGVELEYSRWILTEKAKQTFGIFPKWSLGLNYVDFGHPDLGYSVNGVAYVEPFFKVKGGLRFSGKLGTGVAYMSKPYHSHTNPLNLTNSTKLAFPLVGALSIYYFFNDQYAIKVNASFRHISNGGISKPNLGINYPVIGVAIEHSPNSYLIPNVSSLNPYEKNNRSELLLGYSSKKDTVSKDHHNVIVLNYNRSFRGGRINAFTFSGMAEYQQSHVVSKAKDQWSIAPLVGNEFLIGNLRFGQQLGVYILQAKNAPNDIFQNYYLRYQFRQKITTGVNLKVHGRVADYLAIQVGIVL